MTPPTICFIAISSYGYFNPEYGIDYGGTQRQMYLLSRALASEYDVHVVVGDYGQPSIEEINDITLHRAYPITRDSNTNLVEDGTRFMKLMNAMRNSNADLYIHNGLPQNASICYTIARALRSKWIYHIASDANISSRPAELSFIFSWIFRRNITQADLIIAQSEHQKHLLSEKWDVESTIVPNGYPTASTIIPHEEREYILWVGRICDQPKQPHIFIDVAKQIPDETFVLVGPLGTTEEYNKEIIDQVNNIDNIHYHGSINPNEIHKYFQNAKLLVNTSEFEGFPNTFLEAWRFGTPIVGYNVDPERFLKQGPNTYADGSINTLVEEVGLLASSASTREKIGNSVKSQFEKQYSINKVAEMYSDCIKYAL